MASYQVTWINPDGADIDRRIDRLGGPGWGDSIDTIIHFIRSGAHDFWTDVQGRRVAVVVRQHHQTMRYYLTTLGDGFPPNNLLRLPRRP
jgi:hypothetical protein